MFYVLLPDRSTRDRVLSEMHRQGVHATFHYVPLHSAPGGRRFSAREVECPVSDSVSGRILRLPYYTDLTEDDAARVAECFLAAVSR